MSVVFERRSVRNFLNKPVEPEKIERILRAGFEAPSAHNRRPWEFIVITDTAGREAVAAMSPYAGMAAGAAAVIAACANLKAGAAANPEDTWWVQDLSAATENILLQITGEGLGGVWLGWYPDQGRVKAFSETFGLPPHIIPFSVTALGYPAGPVKRADRFDPSRVFYGRYGENQPG
ncbi:MAG: nitroreductase family protein [Spirochaetaceae bacterium]|jgi:nitroreductase|nr:nitroreductase family protein [Spirochaetaceae bacterium]